MHDLVGHLAALDDPVRRGDEAVLGHLGVGGQRPDQADVRALRGLDRAHAPVVGRVDVADLDRRTLAREAAGAQSGEPSAVPEPGEAVRLVHELGQLARAEELLQRGHDRADVDDRLRSDRVGVLGGEALADDALHPVQADAERLLDQLAHGAQPAVAEVLVLVEVILDRLARHRQRLSRVVLDLGAVVLGHAEQARQRDQLANQGDDVVVGQRPGLEVDIEVQTRVELVTAHAREVVALGVEEQLVEQRARGVDRGRLARALLLEQLDQRALLAADHLGIRIEGQADVQRVVEQVEDLLVRRIAHRAQQHRDRELALAVDADVDAALLVDFELEPRPAGGHQVRDEDLLLAILRLHHVGAGGTDQLRDHDALGSVDDERAALGHPREIAHEHGLLADLAGLPVDERDGDRQRPGVGQILLAALLEVGDRLVKGEVAELNGEVAGVILDRRDVVDRFAQTAAIRVGQPRERLALDIDEIGDFKDLVQTREATARPGGVSGCQDGDSSETVEREAGQRFPRARTPGDPRARTPHEARPSKIAQGNAALWRDAQLSRTPPSDRRVCGAAPLQSGGCGYWLTGAV